MPEVVKTLLRQAACASSALNCFRTLLNSSGDPNVDARTWKTFFDRELASSRSSSRRTQWARRTVPIAAGSATVRRLLSVFGSLLRPFSSMTNEVVELVNACEFDLERSGSSVERIEADRSALDPPARHVGELLTRQQTLLGCRDDDLTTEFGDRRRQIVLMIDIQFREHVV